MADKTLSDILNLAAVVLAFLALSGVAASLPKELFTNLKTQKKPLLIAGLCQFVAMPFIAYVCVEMLAVPWPMALGLILCCIAPGGGLSNMLVYVGRMDTGLSVAMTTCSTLVAIGLVPLNLLIYGKLLITDENLKVPFMDIVKALAILVVSLAIGWFSKRLEKVNKCLIACVKPCFAVYIALLFFGFYIHWDVISTLTGKSVVASFLCPILGFGFGLGFSWLTGLTLKQAFTVSIETGIQNALFPLVTVVLNFSDVPEMYVFPMVYPLTSSLVACLFTALGFRISTVQEDKTRESALRMSSNGLKAVEMGTAPGKQTVAAVV